MTAPAASTLAEVVAGLSSSRTGVSFVSHDAVERLSYAEIGELAEGLARRWRGLGVEAGDRVMLALPSKREFALAFLAAVRAGVVPVPVFPPEHAAQVDLGVERVRSVSRHCRERLVLTSALLAELCSATTSGRAATLADLASSAPGPLPPGAGADDLAFLQYTSGSTGDPKGIAISHRNILANLRATAATMRLTGDDVGVSWLPLYHDMGLMFLLTPTLLEADLWQVGTAAFIQRPTIWMDWMSRTRATVTYGPSFAYELLARRARPRHLEAWDLSAWRIAGCGAEPVRPSALRAFAEAMRPAGFDERALVPAYGLAEATLTVTSRRPGCGMRTLVVDPEALAADGAVRPAAEGIELVSCGPPVEGVEVRVAAAPDRQGEVRVRGPSVADGYWNDEAGSASTFVDGWLHTGDLGFSRDGELYVTGRIKELVIRNGSNYHPHDIERAFCGATGLHPAHVVAFSGREEELVVAVEGRPAGGDGVLAGIRQVMATVGVSPDRVVLLPRGAIPKTSSGKPRRGELRRRVLGGEVEILEVRP